MVGRERMAKMGPTRFSLCVGLIHKTTELTYTTMKSFNNYIYYRYIFIIVITIPLHYYYYICDYNIVF